LSYLDKVIGTEMSMAETFGTVLSVIILIIRILVALTPEKPLYYDDAERDRLLNRYHPDEHWR